MVDVGTRATLINAKKVFLEIGTNRYVKLFNLHFIKTHDEFPYDHLSGREWFYGYTRGEIQAELLATSAEIETIDTLSNADSKGVLTSSTMKIVAVDRSSNTKTISIAGVLPDWEAVRPSKGAFILPIRIRLTDEEVSIT